MKQILRMESYFVEFLNGALTTIHFHETEQILLPIYGKGVVGEIKKNTVLYFELDDIELKFLDVGEIVSIPSNILHFHHMFLQNKTLLM